MDGLPLARWKCLHTLSLIKAFTGYIKEEKGLLATCRDRMMAEYEAHQQVIADLREGLDKAPDEHAARQTQKALDAALRYSQNTYDKLTLEGRKRTHQNRIDRYEAEVRRLWAQWGELHAEQGQVTGRPDPRPRAGGDLREVVAGGGEPESLFRLSDYN